MKYLLILLLLTSCGGDDHPKEFDGVDYIKSIVNDLYIKDNLIIINK